MFPFSDIRHGSISEKIAAMLLIVALTLLVFLIGILGFGLVDGLNVATKINSGTILKKEYVTSKPIFNVVGKAIIVQVFPSKHEVEVLVNNKSGMAIVSKDFWDKTFVGDKVIVTYGYGRISNNIYIKNVAN